jgi:intracellular multiplication protein IcmE
LKEAGFSVDNILRFLSMNYSGFSVEDLKNAGFTAQELLNAHKYGFGFDDLKNAGFTFQELMNEKKDLKEEIIKLLKTNNNDGKYYDDIIEYGYKKEKLLSEMNIIGKSTSELLDMGMTPTFLRKAGFSATELKDKNSFPPGFTAYELKDAGFTIEELKDAGFTIEELNAADNGKFLEKMKSIGFSVFKFKQLFSAEELIAAKFEKVNDNDNTTNYPTNRLDSLDTLHTFEELLMNTNNYDTRENVELIGKFIIKFQLNIKLVINNNYYFGKNNMKIPNDLLISLTKYLNDVNPSVFSVQFFKKRKITPTFLKKIPIQQLIEGGFSLQELKNGFTALDFYKGGISIKEAETVFSKKQMTEFYPIQDLLDTGEYNLHDFELKRLVESKIPFATLKQAGFTLFELANHFSVDDMLNNGITLQDLATNIELKTNNGEKIKKFILILISKLKKNNINDGLLKDMKKKSFLDLYLYCGISVKYLKEAGFSASELKNDFLDRDKDSLKYAFSATELKEAGFTVKDLINMKFSENELKEAGFKRGFFFGYYNKTKNNN